MGRIFEVRKHTMFARWDRMSKAFTRIGKEIVVAVKAGGTDPALQPGAAPRRSRTRARSTCRRTRSRPRSSAPSGKDATNYDEIIYEGYAPHGVAVIVEAATDNPTRTVANVRAIFTKDGGNLGATGSVAFQFRKHGRVPARPRRHRPGRRSSSS